MLNFASDESGSPSGYYDRALVRLEMYACTDTPTPQVPLRASQSHVALALVRGTCAWHLCVALVRGTCAW